MRGQRFDQHPFLACRGVETAKRRVVVPSHIRDHTDVRGHRLDVAGHHSGPTDTKLGYTEAVQGRRREDQLSGKALVVELADKTVGLPHPTCDAKACCDKLRRRGLSRATGHADESDARKSSE